MRLAAILTLLTIIISQDAFADPPPTPEQNILLFKCGLLDGCFQDFRAIGLLADGLIPVLNEFAMQPDATDLREEVLSIEQNLENCNQNVFDACRVDLAQAEATVEKKIRFLTDESVSPAFVWNEYNKRLHQDAVVRKLCSGAISLEAIESTDTLLFFNTPCTGTEFLKYLPSLSRVPGIETMKSNQSFCRPGMEPTIRIEVNGVPHSSTFIFISSDSTTSGTLTPDHVISNVDSNLIHEFVHYQREFDPDFRRRTDAFLALRYSAARQKYLDHTVRLDVEIKRESLRVQNLPNLSDSQRNAMLADFVRSKARAFDQWLGSQQMPVLAGSGSTNATYSSLTTLPAHATGIFSSPQFINGVAQEYHFTDYITISAGFPFGQKLTFDTVDAYGLTNPDEYLAVALTAYRNDPASVARNYSAEELRWLQENWRHGYLTK